MMGWVFIKSECLRLRS